MDVDASYAYCERLTRNQARNFYYGIRLLPEPKRLALSAVYAFAREIDDIGDGDLPADRKVAELARMRKQLKDLSADRDPVAVALADAATRFPIPLPALDELIDGVEMDVRETEYETFDELRVYCRCVAGTVGGSRWASSARATRCTRPISRTPWASRSRSPTSSATSRRTRTTAGSTCPARTWPSSASRTPGTRAAGSPRARPSRTWSGSRAIAPSSSSSGV